jgi:hypothetical protein
VARPEPDLSGPPRYIKYIVRLIYSVVSPVIPISSGHLDHPDLVILVAARVVFSHMSANPGWCHWVFGPHPPSPEPTGRLSYRLSQFRARHIHSGKWRAIPAASKGHQAGRPPARSPGGRTDRSGHLVPGVSRCLRATRAPGWRSRQSPSRGGRPPVNFPVARISHNRSDRIGDDGGR